MVHVTHPAKQNSVKHPDSWWLSPKDRGTFIRVALIIVDNSRKRGFFRNIGEIKFILGSFSQELEACAPSYRLTPAAFLLKGPLLGDSERGAAHFLLF